MCSKVSHVVRGLDEVGVAQNMNRFVWKRPCSVIEGVRVQARMRPTLVLPGLSVLGILGANDCHILIVMTSASGDTMQLVRCSQMRYHVRRKDHLPLV